MGRRSGPGGCLSALLSLGRRSPSERDLIVPVAPETPIPPGTTTQDVVVNLNPANAVGNIRRVILILDKPAGPNATPAGWTRVGAIHSAGPAHSQAIYIRFREALDPDTVTFTVSDGVLAVAYGGSVVSRSGVSPTWPIADDQVTVFAGTSAPNAPAATATARKSLAETVISADTAATYTPPSGFKERTDSSAIGLSLEVSDRTLAQAGSVDPSAGVSSASLANGIARTLVYNPATVTSSPPATTPTFVASTTQEGSASIPTLTVPTGVQAGDILFAAFAFDNGGGEADLTGGTPSGWYEIAKAAWGNQFQLYYRIATASEPASYAFHSASNWRGFMVAYRGADQTLPVVIEQLIESSGSSATPTGVSLTTRTANTMRLDFMHINHNATFTPPAGMTERVDYPHVGADGITGMSMAVFEEARATAGATGTRAATTSVGEQWLAFTVELQAQGTVTESVVTDRASLLAEHKLTEASGNVLDYSGTSRWLVPSAGDPTRNGTHASFVPANAEFFDSAGRIANLGPDVTAAFVFRTTFAGGASGHTLLGANTFDGVMIRMYLGKIDVLRQGTAAIITSPGAYNNGAWHCVIFTETADATALFVDGASVATGTDATDFVNRTYRVGSSAQYSDHWDGDIAYGVVYSAGKTGAQAATLYADIKAIMAARGITLP